MEVKVKAEIKVEGKGKGKAKAKAKAKEDCPPLKGGHSSNKSPSKRPKHEKGDRRRGKDQRRGEKGDKRRPY